MRRLAAIAVALMLAAPALADWPAEKLGEQENWDAAFNTATGVRFIPFQLIVPALWDGRREIAAYPTTHVDPGGDRWSGPLSAPDAFVGKTVAVYARVRNDKREGEVTQHFAVRPERDGIGRIYDSRFGGIRCAGEIKFPLGEWRQAETRRNEFLCARPGEKPTGRVNVIVIENIDFECRGVAHCLQFTWTHYREGKAEPLDDRRYIFAPGLGLAAAERRR